MQLEELGQQYIEQSRVLVKKIHDINAGLKTLEGNELLVLKRRIYSLYSDAADCRRLGEKLINYYRRSSYGQNNL
ncbi:MAG: hypothetical protein RR177_04310 [Oscillospiraceae bacterium]